MIQENININRNIKATKVLLIDSNGQNLGVISINEALSKAYELGLDLIEVGNKDNVPVCKIFDFKKWQYEQNKKKKKSVQPKKQIKEFKFKPTTSNHDLEYRAKHVDEFLNEGHKIKLVVKFRGREQEHMVTTGKALLERFINLITSNFGICSNAVIEGDKIVMMLSGDGK